MFLPFLCLPVASWLIASTLLGELAVPQKYPKTRHPNSNHCDDVNKNLQSTGIHISDFNYYKLHLSTAVLFPKTWEPLAFGALFFRHSALAPCRPPRCDHRSMRTSCVRTGGRLGRNGCLKTKHADNGG